MGWQIKVFFSFCFIYFSFDTALFLGIGSLDTDEDQSTYYNELASLATQKGYVCLYFINTWLSYIMYECKILYLLFLYCTVFKLLFKKIVIVIFKLLCMSCVPLTKSCMNFPLIPFEFNEIFKKSIFR